MDSNSSLLLGDLRPVGEAPLLIVIGGALGGTLFWLVLIRACVRATAHRLGRWYSSVPRDEKGAGGPQQIGHDVVVATGAAFAGQGVSHFSAAKRSRAPRAWTYR